MPDSAFIVGLLLRLPVVLFSLTIHEFMHAWTAYKCGDDTAYRMGRVTLNPLAHLDPIGTLCLFIGPIGWAKPVPVNRANFNYETAKRDDILVSGAGVATNFTVALVLVLVLRGLVWQHWFPETSLGRALYGMMGWGIVLNFGLAIFNLLPFHPLDGSHILQNLLPLNAAIRFYERRQTGMILLGALLLINWLVLPGFLWWPSFRLTEVFAGETGASLLYDGMWP